MKEHTYQPPVDRLLTYGEETIRGPRREWPDYVAENGLTNADVPELIRLATDDDLFWAEDEEEMEDSALWGPLHAWRALGQLHAEEAVGPLLTLFHEWDDTDWIAEEMPAVMALIGPAAIPALAGYLANPAHELSSRISASACLEAIGNRHPEARSECVTLITRQLSQFDHQDEELNGFLISDLIDLKAIESIDLIRQAYAADAVEEFINGDLEEVEIELGLRKERETPAPKYFAPFLPPQPPEPVAKPLPIQSAPKVGRNEPCPCGSGNKYKKCCLNKATA